MPRRAAARGAGPPRPGDIHALIGAGRAAQAEGTCVDTLVRLGLDASELPYADETTATISSVAAALALATDAQLPPQPANRFKRVREAMIKSLQARSPHTSSFHHYAAWLRLPAQAITTAVLSGVSPPYPPRCRQDDINTSKRIRAQPHSHSARGELTAWWDANILWPYPSLDEKAQLSERSGLTFRQVDDWFTNRRKRYWTNKARARSCPPSAAALQKGGAPCARRDAIECATRATPCAPPLVQLFVSPTPETREVAEAELLRRFGDLHVAANYARTLGPHQQA